MKGCLPVSAILAIVDGTRRYQDSVKDKSSGLWVHKIRGNPTDIKPRTWFSLSSLMRLAKAFMALILASVGESVINNSSRSIVSVIRLPSSASAS